MYSISMQCTINGYDIEILDAKDCVTDVEICNIIQDFNKLFNVQRWIIVVKEWPNGGKYTICQSYKNWVIYGHRNNKTVDMTFKTYTEAFDWLVGNGVIIADND